MKNTIPVFALQNRPVYRNGMTAEPKLFDQKHLREFREAADLKQQQLADLIGTSQPQIRRLEAGERELTKEWAVKLSPHLGRSPVELMFPKELRTQKTLSIVGRV